MDAGLDLGHGAVVQVHFGAGDFLKRDPVRDAAMRGNAHALGDGRNPHLHGDGNFRFGVAVVDDFSMETRTV